ncbi:conserved hypothetical protein [Rubrivivax sp. A210]|uniref:hypothetical protein n=1 Tax=Rubrivivax sp. A210 TaxID=2772301 RepID=UPI00191B5369|nr:hypothetical protein [Rubrivivax sp. A210]CAD5374696.1 conserved hypothetical protein [Rubrivivax sp. A210]
MLNRIPRQVPPLSTMLDDIGRPSPRELARAFDVNERTVRRWLADDVAPMPVLIALFWLTRWGRSQINADAHNDAVLHASIARCQRDEIAGLERRLRHLGRLADFGAANDPAPGVPMLAQVLPPGETAAAQPARPTRDDAQSLPAPTMPRVGR